ncbi:hypothetical protein DM01DRAFT_1362932 [Hesseltinella vesiculosa]|uniref:Transmembrane protein 135 N-terminal domain-containing protein n=1 Tax=Hesseltinella vesiculosa TaxID=101127 RepID=A0A1X2GHL3_9FUNG|nr:hypothetical protein DM01DRAFT_1362932 [Hesseltinella vesiculosa]
MDVRLLDALRAIRDRTWLYGKDTGINDLLGNYCRDLGLPYELGLPERGRIPCTVVHGGQPWGCEVHALSRFSKGFVKIFFLYLMVHGIPPMLFRRKQTMETLPGSALHILKASVRSSTFLGVFISSIWYTICLTRTRIGHQLLGVDQTRLDDTLGPLLGCMACGLSLLIENGRRRGEMALYVVPRALFSLLDRVVAPWYHRGRWWEPHVAEGLETLVFAVSMATILGAMHNDKKRVRSSVRGLLSWIMKNELEPEVDAKQAASLTTDDDML